MPRIAKIRIRNILGIEELEFAPGAFTEISGGNGASKTSTLEAIRAAIKGGEDATLLRKGAKSGESVVLLDDGTEIERHITEKTNTVQVRQNGGKVKRPMELVKGLSDAVSANPIDFIRAPKGRRVDVLLESLPVAMDTARIQAIVGPDTKTPDMGGSAFEQIDALRQTVYDERTGTNRAVREKQATINQLSATLPAAEPAAAEDPADASESDLVAQLAALDEEKDALMAAIDKRLGEYRTEHQAVVSQITAGHRKVIGDLRNQIAQLERQIADEEKAEAAELATETAAQADVELRAANKRTEQTQAFAARREALSGRLKVITSNREAAGRQAQTRQVIATLKAEAEALQADVERQTATLAGLDAYKSEILAALPIDGMEVRDGEIYRHGIVFDRLNQAQQVDIAVEIAKLRAGELGLICLDGIEVLDSTTYEAFRAKAEASGLQFIVTRVTDGPIHIESH